MIYRFLFKRLIDLLIAILALIITMPVLLLVSIILFLYIKGNPFFIQSRPGKKGKVFKVIKFKTMKDKRDLSGNLLPDAERLTFFGKFIRRTSLDELPQLINVLKGDMSLIGPRPLLVEYLPLYNKQQSRRHEIKPGITGWAQVNGRNAISWEQKFEYDIYYVENCSFFLDLKIIFITLQKVFKKDGINQKGQATAEKFNGNN